MESFTNILAEFSRNGLDSRRFKMYLSVKKIIKKHCSQFQNRMFVYHIGKQKCILKFDKAAN